MGTDFRFGSIASFWKSSGHFRSTPIRHLQSRLACLKRATCSVMFLWLNLRCFSEQRGKAGLVSFDGEHDLGEARNGRLAQPVPLQFADQLNFTEFIITLPRNILGKAANEGTK